MNTKHPYHIKSRIWICRDNDSFLGDGRIRLLQEIQNTGSISQAARNMSMSYKKAWSLVQSMNKQSDTPIVERKTGGVNGGGAELSEKAIELIRIYKEITSRNEAFLRDILLEYSL